MHVAEVSFSVIGKTHATENKKIEWSSQTADNRTLLEAMVPEWKPRRESVCEKPLSVLWSV